MTEDDAEEPSGTVEAPPALPSRWRSRIDTVDHREIWAKVHAETFVLDQALKARAKALAERRAALDADERALAEDTLRIRDLRRTAHAYMHGREAEPAGVPDASTRIAPKLKGRDLLESAHRILSKKGSPMTRKAIAHALERFHGRIDSRDLVGHVGMLLWNDKKRFVSLGRPGYALVSWGGPEIEKALARRRPTKTEETEP